jgi:sugar phosphate isomerase/epimerase
MQKIEVGMSRRAFLKQSTMAAAAIGVTVGLGKVTASAQFGAANAAPFVSTSPWAKQIGLELFSVRDVMTNAKSYQAALEKVAEIGYKEIEPASGYGGLGPKEFRALLDRLGLSMPSTHSGATEGPDLEKQLEGFQVMGIKYVEISAPRTPRVAGGQGGPGGAVAGGRGPGGPGGFGAQPPQTSEAVKHTANQLNEHGKIAKKFGMKILVHNHTVEFAPLADDSQGRPYDILLANTDPTLVTMQIDIGWAIQGGQDPIAMFKKNPGRYELWHVKDMNDIKTMPVEADEGKRMQMGSRAIVPIGLGDIDYKPVFAAAEMAGMKHFCIEQDDAADWGDSLAAATVCFKNLQRVLG